MKRKGRRESQARTGKREGGNAENAQTSTHANGLGPVGSRGSQWADTERAGTGPKMGRAWNKDRRLPWLVLLGPVPTKPLTHTPHTRSLPLFLFSHTSSHTPCSDKAEWLGRASVGTPLDGFASSAVWPRRKRAQADSGGARETPRGQKKTGRATRVFLPRQEPVSVESSRVDFGRDLNRKPLARLVDPIMDLMDAS